MLSTSNVAVQFGAKPLFEQVTVKFSDGNRYGLIGANGSGKSTLMKVLGGELEQSVGDVMLQAGLRMGKLNQNQFGYEDHRVIDVVMQGHVEMWAAMQERDRIYANAEATDDDYMRAAELEGKFAEYGGYDAEARAAAILIGAGLPEPMHHGPMREVAPGLKLRVLLAQALFSNGLARLEFIINRMIGVHPRALLEFDRLDGELQDQIRGQMAGYSDPVSFYIDKLAEGIAQIAAAFAPEPVIVRLSDFKSNEYANLIGGTRYEPEEENPMLGFRGASRYVDETFRPCFELECRALKKVRGEMGLTNVQIMVPFVRTLTEAAQVVELLSQNGLRRGTDGLKVIMMCELPSNAVLAEEFLEHFDGMSIGSNDMTQLTLGLDRDSSIVAKLFDERDPAVKKMLAMAIAACKKKGKYVGICGQGPSDHPELARWLLDQGIESMSLNPDTVVETWMFLAQKDV
jgi:ABC-type branched-subunit amino acid transport system ATPase component